MGTQFRHSSIRKVAEFFYKTDESIKQVDVSFSLYFPSFVVDIFDVLFSYFLNAKIRISHIGFLKKISTN